jgi:hypothetical protein
MLVRLGLGVVLAAANAHADNRVAVVDPAGPPGLTPEEPPRVDRPVVVDPSPAPLTTLADADAMSDRAFGRSTALVLRSGQFDFSMRTAVEHGSMLSVAAGLGHNIELSSSAGYARRIGDDYSLGVKFGLTQHRTWSLAISTSLSSLSLEGIRQSLLAADLIVTTCAFDCNMMLTAGVGAAVVSDSQTGPVPFLELSMIFGTGYVRPLVEGMTLQGDANLAFAGFRVGGRHVGVDLGVGLIGGAQGGSENDVGMMVGVGVRP